MKTNLGDVYGSLTVIRRIPNKNNLVEFICECTCGEEVEKMAGELRRMPDTQCCKTCKTERKDKAKQAAKEKRSQAAKDKRKAAKERASPKKIKSIFNNPKHNVLRPWIHNGKNMDEIPPLAFGFVYILTNAINKRMYIGQKRFWSHKNLPPLKGKIHRRKIVQESDWREYMGSSTAVNIDIADYGGTLKFNREVLHLAYGAGALNYLELQEQMERKVLLDPCYYNQIVNARISESHVKELT